MVKIKKVEGFMATSSARFATLAGALFAGWAALPAENQASLLALLPADIASWLPSMAMLAVLAFRGTSISVGKEDQ